MIQSFQYLPRGWHYGEGAPCTPAVIEQAIRLHAMMTSLGFFATDAFPGIDGGMLVTLYDGNEYLAFRIEIDGSITYSRETDDVEVEKREMCTLPQAIEILQAYRSCQHE